MKNTKHNRYKYRNEKLPHISIIKAASKGDPIAVRLILNHYERYVTSYTRRRVYTEGCGFCEVVNEGLKNDIERRLIKRAVGFEYKPAE